MIRLLGTFSACTVVLLFAAAPARAQTVPGFDTGFSNKIDCPTKDHCIFEGAVELAKDDWKFYADHAEFFNDKHLLIATGNVAFTQGSNHIAAERAEINTEEKTGVFHVATGTAALGDKVDRSMFGGQEPDMYFYGETIEKIGEDRYRITRGGFTTCLQPTPRWELTSGTAVIRLNHYAFIRNTVLRVKGVPMFYLPAVYYPIKRENRATGFLLPIYGTSTFQGFHLGNAFFWAINRSQDLTVLHDLFSKTGQGFGAEYRYVQGGGSQGHASLYALREHPYDLTNSSGTTSSVAGQQSYRIQSSVNQTIGSHLRASGRVDYFTSVRVQQTYNINIYDASLRQRSIGGNLTGNWGSYSVSGAFDRSEYFFGETNSVVNGSAPFITVSRAERPLGRTPIYVSIGAGFQQIVRVTRTSGADLDTGLARLDVSPRVRFPFTRWPFLTVNSSAGWHDTYWTQSLDPKSGAQVATPISRRYFDVDSRVTGPIFNRIFNGSKRKVKHVIEPFFNVVRTSAIDKYLELVKVGGTDFTIGGMTQMSYGLTNRLLVKPTEAGPGARSREILSVDVRQSYYTDARASLYDASYSTAFRSSTATNFSSISLTARTAPTDHVGATFQMEWDPNIGVLQSVSANGNATVRDWLHVTGGWSHRRTLVTAYLEYDSLNTATTVRLFENRVGGTYSFNYDLGRKYFVQNRITAFYNTQCCGVAFEYQSYNYSGLQVLGNRLTQDRRFNFSFTLAGLGTFSNLLGAFGGGTGTGVR